MRGGMVGMNLTFYDLKESGREERKERHDATSDYCCNDLLTNRELVKAQFWGSFFGGFLGMIVSFLLVKPFFV